MKMRQKFNVTLRWHLIGTAAILTAMSAFGQTLQLDKPAEAGLPASAGEHLAIPELPQPEWREEMGAPVARLRLNAPNAAAWTVGFQSLGLGQDKQMFLYGISAAGNVSAVHGPYVKNGPLNVPGFQSNIIEGAELVIEVRGGSQLPTWPFLLELIERIDATQLAALKQQGLQIEPVHRPQTSDRQASEIRYAWFDEELVPYRVIDGLAISGGDIVLGTADQVAGGNAGKTGGLREAHETTVSAWMWPNGVIPYTIQYDSILFPGHYMENRILNTIAYYNAKFPGMLVKRTTQTDYVTFRFNGRFPDCQSSLGRVSGQQFIDLNTGCFSRHIIHEIGHALGLWHEHQRPDRDSWVTIHWQNIDPDYLDQFTIPASGSRALGPYDFSSRMHYGPTAFSYDGSKPTISMKTSTPGVTLGGADELSAGDIAGIRARYCDVANWKVQPASMLADGNGSNHTIQVTAPPYCTWTASESVSWISIPAASKTGSGRINVTVFANFGAARAANIRIESGSTSRSVRVDQPLDPHNVN